MISRTDPVIKTIDDLLFPQVQRYYFFSKSQLRHPLQLKVIRCSHRCKGTNFLANHNIR